MANAQKSVEQTTDSYQLLLKEYQPIHSLIESQRLENHQMTESKYWSLKPLNSKLAPTSDERS
jgi:hypothetical protein